MQRRRFLAGVASVAGAVLAGCSALGGGSDGDGASTPLSAVEKWVLAPEETDDGLEGINARATSLSSVFGKADRLDSDYVGDLQEGVLPRRLDIERSTLEDVVDVTTGSWSSAGLYRVTRGAFDGDAIAADLEEVQYTKEGETGSWTLFADGLEKDTWVAVTDDAMVFTFFGGGGVEEGRTTIEAIDRVKDGDAPSLFDRAGPHRRVHDRLPDGDSTEINVERPGDSPADIPGEFEDVLAVGSSRTLENATSTRGAVVYEFEDQSAVEAADFESYRAELVADASLEVDYEVDGKTVELEYEGDRGEI